MDAKEIEDILTKLQRVGLARCEKCRLEVPFSDVTQFDGIFVCSGCLRQMAWKSEEPIDLPA